MIDKKRILIKVKSFLTEYFPHAYGAMKSVTNRNYNPLTIIILAFTLQNAMLL